MTTTTTHIEPVADALARIDTGLLWLRQQIDNPRRYASGRARLMTIVTRDYLPALDILRRTGGLREAHTTIVQRLEKGWQIEQPTDQQADLFERLLYQHNALADAIDGRTVNTILDRLSLLDAISEPLHKDPKQAREVDTYTRQRLQ